MGTARQRRSEIAKLRRREGLVAKVARVRGKTLVEIRRMKGQLEEHKEELIENREETRDNIDRYDKRRADGTLEDLEDNYQLRY